MQVCSPGCGGYLNRNRNSRSVLGIIDYTIARVRPAHMNQIKKESQRISYRRGEEEEEAEEAGEKEKARRKVEIIDTSLISSACKNKSRLQAYPRTGGGMQRERWDADGRFAKPQGGLETNATRLRSFWPWRSGTDTRTEKINDVFLAAREEAREREIEIQRETARTGGTDAFYISV